MIRSLLRRFRAGPDRPEPLFQNDAGLEQALKARLREYEERTGRLPVVALEDFFQGNADPGSIGCNLPRHPGPAAFAEALYGLRALPQVKDVRVGITDPNQGDDGIWPFSDWVYVLTSLPADAVKRRLKVTGPDEVFYQGAPNTEHPDHGELPQPRLGDRLVIAWWD